MINFSIIIIYLMFIYEPWTDFNYISHVFRLSDLSKYRTIRCDSQILINCSLKVNSGHTLQVETLHNKYLICYYIFFHIIIFKDAVTSWILFYYLAQNFVWERGIVLLVWVCESVCLFVILFAILFEILWSR